MATKIQYDYDLAIEYKSKGMTNEQIANIFGYANEAGFRRKFKRDRSKTASNTRSIRQSKRTKSILQEKNILLSSDTDELEYHQNLTLEEIRRIPYGKLEPTMLISDLSHPAWLKKYGGEHRYRYDLEPLNQLCDLLYTGDKEAALLPRFGGKTVTYLGITPREIAEIRQPHLTICSPKRPKVLFRGVVGFMMGYRAAQFRKDYGDIIAVENGAIQANKTELTVTLHEEFNYDHTDPVYKTASRESDIIGWHGAHIHFEDPSQQENAAGTAKLIEWYGEVVEPMISLENDVISRLTATTTRKGRKDFANFLFDDGWKEFRYAAVEVLSGRLPNSGDIVWKENVTRSGQITREIDYIEPVGTYKLFNPAWNLQKILTIAIKKYSSFMSQYQNTPISVDSDFLEPLDIIPPIDRKHFDGQEGMIIDPAFGKSASSSETAIIIGFSVPNIDDIYITEVIIDRLPGTKLVAKIYELARQRNLKWIKIENDFYQITTRQGTMQALQKLPNFGVFYNKGYGDKHARVQMLEEPLAMKHIHIFDNCNDLHKLEDQVNGYSEDADIDHGYDGLDALASFHRLVSKSGQLYVNSWTSRR